MTEVRGVAATIVASEIGDDLKKINDLEEALKFAFRKVQNHWMFTDKHDQFAAAVAAVGLRFGIDSPEFERLRKASEAQKRGVAVLNALHAGIPVDLESMVESMKDEEPVIPLNKLWWDAVGEARAAPMTKQRCCPYCGSLEREDRSILHEGGCAGLETVDLNRLQLRSIRELLAEQQRNCSCPYGDCTTCTNVKSMLAGLPDEPSGDHE